MTKATKGKDARENTKGLASQNEAPKLPLPTQLSDQIQRAGFKWAGTTDNEGHTLIGFRHEKDGRALLLVYDGKKFSNWAIKKAQGDQLGGKTTVTLLAGIEESTPTVAEDVARTTRLRERQKAEEYNVDKGASDNIVRGLQKLGAWTKQRFNINDLRGEDNYGKRMQVLKALRGATAKVLAKDCAVGAFTNELCKAVGAKDPVQFIMIAKHITSKARVAAKQLKQAARREVAENAARAGGRPQLPGDIKPAVKRMTKAARRKEKEALRRQLLGTPEEPRQPSAEKPPMYEDVDLGTKREQLGLGYAYRGAVIPYKLGDKPESALPVPEDAEFFDHKGCALVEHIHTGVVMLKLANFGLNGAAPCVYNDGRTVSLGMVPLETLSTKFRTIQGADIHAAARQLLAPFSPAVKLLPVAERHLTAVLNCKELTNMATKKFAAPADVKAPKAAKAPKAEKPAKTAKAPKAKKTAAASEGSNMYTGLSIGRLAGRKIKVLKKDHGAKPGTKRATGMEIILKHKDTDSALEALKKAGCDATYFKHAVAIGLVQLS